MRVITITDDMLINMAASQDFRSIVPGLGNLNITKTCKCRGRAERSRHELATIKSLISNMSKDSAAQLKKKLNVDKLVVYVKENNKIVKKEL